MKGGVATVVAGGTDSGSVIHAGGNEILSGGSAMADMVSGVQTVFSGVFVSRQTVAAGGTITIAPGGSDAGRHI